MNHDDSRLIEIGQKEGYAKAVREIVAWLRDQDNGYIESAGYIHAADEIEAKFGKRDDPVQ